MRHYCLIALLSFFLFNIGCNHDKKDILSIKSLGTTTFEIPFEPYTYAMGCLPGKDTGTDQFYFASFKTNKGYALCRSNGALVKYIPFSSGILDQHSFDGLWVKSPDSIFTYAHEENTLFQLNDTGEIVNRLQHAPPVWNGHNYNCYGSRMCIRPGKNSIFLSAHFKPPIPPKPGIEGRSELYNIQNAGPVLGEMRIDRPQDKVNWQLTGFQQRYTPPDYEGEYYMKYALSEDYIYLYTSFSDTLYKVSIKSSQLVKKIPLKSRYTTLDTKPQKITQEIVANNSWLEHALRENAIAWTIRYDPYHKLIYLPMYHAVAPSHPPISEEKSRLRKWSLMVFDENLEILGEFPFPEEKYNPSAMIVTPTNLLIKKNDNSIPLRKTIFERFEISYN